MGRFKSFVVKSRSLSKSDCMLGSKWRSRPSIQLHFTISVSSAMKCACNSIKDGFLSEDGVNESVVNVIQ